MLKLNSDLCSSSSYIDIYIGSEDALNVVWQQNVYTAQCAVKAYVHSLLSRVSVENFASIYLPGNFHEPKEENVELGKICAPSTVNNTESESTRSLSSELCSPEKAASHFY